ncbi:MAG: thiol reductant ABC exporter subunit CydC [Anaerolineae bacterium]
MAAGGRGETLRRLLGLARPFAPQMGLAALAGLLTIGSSVGLLAAGAWIISAAALQPGIAALQVAIVGVRFFGITRGVFRYLERLLAHQVSLRLLARLRTWFYAALEPLAPARLMDYHSGDLLGRIVADIETLQEFYVRVIAPPLVALLTGLMMAAFTARYDLHITLTLLAFFAAGGIGLPLLVRHLVSGTGAARVQARAALNTALVDGVQGLADLTAAGAVEQHIERVEALSARLEAQGQRLRGIEGVENGLVVLVTGLAMLSALVVAIPRVEGVHLASIVLGVAAGFEAILPLALAARHLDGDLEAAGRLFEIVDVQPEIIDPPDDSPTPHDWSLQIEGLTFRYAPGLPPALENISLSAALGERVAVVGPSGAGKSTLVQVLLRFREYEAGAIRLGGYDLRRYRQDDLRALIGVVTQQTHLFNTSIRENLLIARPDADDVQIEEACRRAQIHEVIAALPRGFDTVIGEGGARLSGGERQRIAIARVLLKDAPLLILDEATANLDALTEREVLASLEAAIQGRTTLIITHRLVGLETFDKVIVLYAGHVVETGTPADLMRRDGLFRRMLALQRDAIEGMT